MTPNPNLPADVGDAVHRVSIQKLQTVGGGEFL